MDSFADGCRLAKNRNMATVPRPPMAGSFSNNAPGRLGKSARRRSGSRQRQHHNASDHAPNSGRVVLMEVGAKRHESSQLYQLGTPLQ